jgi:hypothetical protein
MVDFTIPVFVSSFCTSVLHSVSNVYAGKSHLSIQKLPGDEPTERGGYTDVGYSEILSKLFPSPFFWGQCSN